MKRFVLSLALGAGLVIGCSDAQTVPTAAGLAGTYDLTLVGNHVFVTSSDRNELRVLDLAASPRDFVRAPNPLEPLSIPVLDRPLNLTKDVRYGTTGEELGQELAGSYIYARSAGSEEISVVAAAPEYFREIKRLRLGELTKVDPSDPSPAPVAGFVTAIAARGAESGGSTLYLSTQNLTEAKLWKVELGAPEALEEQSPESLQLTRIALDPAVALMPGETVTALLVMPEPDRLVVATRDVRTRGGRTFLLNAATGQQLARFEFGSPVRLLVTHPRVETTSFQTETCALDTTTPAKGSLNAGEYVFGVRDESACGGQPACSGVLAVDAATGQVATDSTGHPMLPISVSPALPTGLTLAPGGTVQMRCLEPGANGNVQSTEIQARPLVGIIPASNGQITFFDAVKMRHFDLDTTGPSVGGRVLLDVNGQARTITQGLIDRAIEVQLLEGAARDEVYRLVYQGILPDLASLSASGRQCSATECAFPVGVQALPNVAPQDFLVLEGDEGACATDLVVSRIDPAGTVFTGPLPAGCEGAQRFSLRAGGDRPFAVYADTTGFLGRLGDGDPAGLTVPGDYFYHPQGFNPATPPYSAILRLYLNRESLQPLPQRGEQFAVTTLSGFVPFVFGVNTESLSAGLTAYRLPGPVVHTKVGGTDLAYIAYPSADGILQVNMRSVSDNAANSQGLVPFE